MQTVAGVFTRRADAERAASGLEAIGIPRDRITLLAPSAAARQVPTDEGERPGTGAVLGAVVGSATGAAIGFPLGAAVTLLVPGVGAVVASGLIGAVLFGAGGAAVGATLEESLEESLVTGLPRDELFVYEDGLRHGRSVVVALVEDENLAETARRTLAGAGVETIDAARERWWLGLRSAEQEHYARGAAAFERDEAFYRRGFEAALGADTRGRAWGEAVPALRARCGAAVEAPAFRHGWERGQVYHRDLGFGTGLKKSA